MGCNSSSERVADRNWVLLRSFLDLEGGMGASWTGGSGWIALLLLESSSSSSHPTLGSWRGGGGGSSWEVRRSAAPLGVFMVV
jgi:hypothetical protein